MEEEAGRADSDRLAETVGWLAISSGAGTWDDLPYIAGTTEASLTPDSLTRIPFQGRFVDDPNNPPAPPQFWGAVNSYNDSSAVGLRYQKVTPWVATLKLETGESGDRLPESASFLALQGANPTLEAIPLDETAMAAAEAFFA